ncbi:pfkB carbohydrate kinase family protein [Mycobacterium kansasii]|uniref:PfkB carbohydrate kinase family protein n=1 Tax=Mycobacterium kansasii TaxID=1768 RepID=A0A1V3XIS1_MYCKA|nr:pfkB carbohydrate kinase family protein [Mycobacterium kansasii]
MFADNVMTGPSVVNVGTMTARRVCVVGSLNMDLTFAVTTLPRPGETVLASALNCAPGGKGGNQAVAAARAGAHVQFVGAVGDDAAADQLRPTCWPTVSALTEWSGCPARAGRRSLWSIPAPRTPSWWLPARMGS